MVFSLERMTTTTVARRAETRTISDIRNALLAWRAWWECKRECRTSNNCEVGNCWGALVKLARLLYDIWNMLCFFMFWLVLGGWGMFRIAQYTFPQDVFS